VATSLRPTGAEGLERSCAPGEFLRGRGPIDGVELMEARFGRRAYGKHRHDTYGITLTELGVLTFEYRGRVETGLPGQVVVLHPDELHDGRPADETGLGYRIVYVEPARIAEAVRAIRGRPGPLPFVREPVVTAPRLARAVASAFLLSPGEDTPTPAPSEGESGLEPLARDGLVLRLAEGLLAADPAERPAPPPRRLDVPALERARAFLHGQPRVVRSAELEAIAGLTRYELARQFRVVYGTSPYRYSLMRRLDLARDDLRRGASLAGAAVGAGFADQPHFTRVFRAAFGVTPGRYARLHALGG
jgi:AraC-like DNA-binding protein